MLHLFVNQYLFLQCITEFLHWNYHWVFLWFCRLYSDGLELGSDLWLPAVVLWNSASHVSTMLRSNLDLPIIRSLIFYTLMLAYKTTTGSAPTYFHSLLWIYIPSRGLRSASERHLVVPSHRGSKSLSRTFSFTIPGWWNDLPTPTRNAGSLSIFKQQLKTHLFQHYLTSS